MICKSAVVSHHIRSPITPYNMPMTKITGDKVKKRKLIFLYKNILLIISVIWMLSFAYQRTNVPLFTEDPGRVRKGEREQLAVVRLMLECLQSWGEDLCGSPLPHDYRTVQGCLIKSRHRPGDSQSFPPSLLP